MRVKWGFLALAVMMMLAACQQVALFERIKNIPGGSWNSSEQPEIALQITDTSASYKLYAVVRHTNLYPYRNLWLNVGLQLPGDSGYKTERFDIALAGADQWLGKGMDDVYEIRPLLFPAQVRFSKPGAVKFKLQQAMRQNPLPGVLQVGIRIEKVVP
jgi:gliding motility-associated lipoprotein GldH